MINGGHNMFSNKKKTTVRIFSIVVAVMMLVLSLTGCATATTDESETGISSSFMIIYLVVIVVVFYFFMIRPEKKRRKQSDDMRSNLSVGDTITTIGGIVGKIVDINNDFITIETSEDRVRVQLAKWGVSSVGKNGEEDPNNK
jgi:preprotein translocase subunit YajC